MSNPSESSPRVVRCPVCGKPADMSNAAALPFCSMRCKRIDLGRWVDERYSVPEPKRPNEDSLGDEEPTDER